MAATVETFNVESKGVGRRDYSMTIEHSVEPLIRSYQDQYTHWEEVTLAPGANIINIAVPSGYTVILYDFYVSTPSTVQLLLRVQIVTDTTGTVVVKSDYGTVHELVPKGYPFTGTIRFTVTNYGDESISGWIGCVGIQTTTEQYQLAPV